MMKQSNEVNTLTWIRLQVIAYLLDWAWKPGVDAVAADAGTVRFSMNLYPWNNEHSGLTSQHG